MTPAPARSALLCCLAAVVPACAILGSDDDDDTTSLDTIDDTGVGDDASSGDPSGDPGTSETDGDPSTGPDPSDSDPSDTAADSTGGDVGALPSAVAIAIANGRLHSCALTDAGVVRCWGNAESGQLGNGAPFDTTAYRVPVEVEGLAGVTAISSFSDHTCALDADGAVWCWGDNDFGQLGDGTTSPSNVPLAVPGLVGARAIAAGWEHTCAITADGSAACWGKNDYGQLGNDTNVDAGAPVTVVGLSGVTAIAAGRYHTCAVTDGGAAWCWGGDTFGELGNDEATSASYVPVMVGGLDGGVTHIAAGDSVGCAITESGAAQCWGVNGDGQLGNGQSGSFVESHTPTAVIGLTAGVTAIAPGFGYTCAVVDGAAKCWGDNGDGNLGNGEAPGYQSPTPVDVTGLGSGVETIDTCSGHACAMTTAGAVWCWGNNDGGSLGDGGTDSTTTPVAVVSLP